jgi:hypothetical protein
MEMNNLCALERQKDKNNELIGIHGLKFFFFAQSSGGRMIFPTWGIFLN